MFRAHCEVLVTGSRRNLACESFRGLELPRSGPNPLVHCRGRQLREERLAGWRKSQRAVVDADGRDRDEPNLARGSWAIIAGNVKAMRRVL